MNREYMRNVATAVSGNALIIRLNRPEKRNAFSLELTLSTRDAVAAGCRDYGGVIITGEGKVFSAGLDLAEVYGFKTIDDSRKYFSAIRDLVVTIANCERPVIALVNGSAYGFATELLYFVDHVVAVRGSEFSLPGIRYGLVPVTPAFAPYLFGILRSRFFLDRDFRLGTDEAVAWGLVHRVVDNVDEGLRESLGLIEKINDVPHGTYLAIKKLMISSLIREASDRWDELLNTLAVESLKPEVKARLGKFLRK
ncbi:enoyl-CoA hydratase/isomerase family protein [Vulcanisaeta souniana]|uniref:Enoyl-CoA hydratase n=1 Tax=Vulcanisaeta souniana JCM 11219 TaxID=1293586 RepID=A0A830EDS6_9CREN|nr:enoyl-CoA hydratase/isomerase family protein [Vulcanisaeta souniana]BDR92207.1 enoyl-CoA hydratase [Vulcanisaeta souniana JCM 11219]GGI67106.1 enoyl-CoA hydratase [Vulcanisaeta souniana JCM 11219]